MIAEITTRLKITAEKDDHTIVILVLCNFVFIFEEAIAGVDGNEQWRWEVREIVNRKARCYKQLAKKW